MENQTNNMYCGNSKIGKAIVAVLLVALSVYVLVLAFNAAKASKYVGRDAAAQSTISVSGNGEVYKDPNLAVMNFSVVSFAKTVDAAMADNTKKMNAIIDAAKSFGVAENDLQTTGFNVAPRYDYVKEAAAPVSISAPEAGSVAGSDDMAVSRQVYYPSGKQVLSGYDITQTLTVKMRDLTKIGQIIQELTAAGANQAGNLQFTLDKPDEAQAEARKIAIDNAKTKAEKLAKDLGVKLVRILNYNDGGYAPVYQLNYAAKDMGAGEESVPSPNIQTGQNKITVNANITYEIE
ncbi:MAG: SIMPL domain-containing protein [Candidatus Nealsonbacteria bacterium DGGOD1a]|nr:MAG: SIMPL domain-containing protein [Candidatus Nealsonbacteria bacterium DGGOD1a]